MRKIGELKGKPIIEGNPNEIKKNQIHYKESDGNITLSERKEDNTLSSVTSGSGSGEEAFQYFKIIDTNSDFLKLVGNFSKVVELITSYKDSYIKINRIDEYYSDMALSEFLDISRAFKVVRGDFSMMVSNNNNNYTYIKGNTLKDKVLYIGKITNAPEEEINAILQEFNSAFQEITKEEYEAMITYKPE